MDNDTIAESVMVAFRESFESGMMVTNKIKAKPGSVQVDASFTLPEGVVKELLGEMYGGAVSHRPPSRTGQEAKYELKGTQTEGDADVSFDDGSAFPAEYPDHVERPASPENDGEI